MQTQQLLRRSTSELEKLTALGIVANDETEGLVGFCAVEIYSRKMAELQCLAVATAFQGRGIGKFLVEQCVRLAAEHDVHELMAITASDQLFQGIGFDYSLPNQKRALFIHPQQR